MMRQMWQPIDLTGCPVCNGTGRKAIRRSHYSIRIVPCDVCWFGIAELGVSHAG